jgi:enoyl-CoA hydratase/carnithine racemase
VTDGAPVVRVEETHDGRVWRLVLDRPQKLNALNEALRAELQNALERLSERPDVRVVVLAGAGRAFSAGADLGDRPPSMPDARGRRHASGRWHRLLDTLERLPQATVASLHGHVIGGGALLAVSCDLRIAADDLGFAIPELAVGIPLTWAGLPRLAREIGLPRTRDLVMTGRRVGATEAERIGLVQRVVTAAELDRATEELVGELLAQPAVPLAMTVDGTRALGRATSAADTAWADPDLLRWSLRERPDPPERVRPDH